MSTMATGSILLPKIAQQAIKRGYMRISYLSKNQHLATQRSSKNTKNHPKCQTLFMYLHGESAKSLRSPSHTLRTRKITPENNTLPFQANVKLFNHSPPKKFQKKSKNQTQTIKAE